MPSPSGWKSIGKIDGVDWEIKEKKHGRFFLMRSVGTQYDPNDPDYPHTLVELENGQLTGFQHNSDDRHGMKFGTRDVIMAAARIVLSI